MHHRLVVSLCTLVVMVAASACAQSADDRARKAAARAREEASTRESETVRRLATPEDSHRILYHPPDDLSDSSARNTGATIVGVTKQPRPTEPPVHSGPPPEKPRD